MRQANDAHQAVRQNAAAQTSRGLESFEAEQTPDVVVRTSPVIAIASGKGGVGKSNIAVNLSIALAMRGLRVTLLDADLGVANADVLCGLSPRARVDGLALEHTPDLARLGVAAPGGFTLVPGAVGLGGGAGTGGGLGRSSSSELSLENRRALLRGLLAMSAANDVLIVDTGAGVGSLVTGLVNAADIGIVVTTPEPTAIADAYALIKCVRRGGTASSTRTNDARGPDADRLFLVVNQTIDEREGRGVAERIDQVSRTFLGRGVGLLGCVPLDAAVGRSVRKRVPLLISEPGSAAAIAIYALGAEVAERLSLGISSEEVRTLTESGLAFPPRRSGVLARLIAATFGLCKAAKSPL